jgi:hypothetical protein
MYGGGIEHSGRTAMFTSTSRGLLACAALALAFLSNSPASAQLREHLVVQGLGPTEDELCRDRPDSGCQPDYEPHELGRAVVIRNGLAFAGMPLTDHMGQVAVFTQTTGGWVRSATITASDRMPPQSSNSRGEEFGRAVSFRDGLLVVGSNRAAYVYQRVNGVWRERQKIVPPSADGIGLFANALKHEAGVLAIGAFGEHGGYLYVLEQDATGRFVRRARFAMSGHSISMTKSMIVVGEGEGASILGRNSSGVWVQRQRLVPAAGLVPSFGFAVAVDNDMILVGAPFFDPSPPPPDSELPSAQTGRVYGFLPGATRYVEAFQLRFEDLPFVDQPLYFGRSLAMFGNRIAVGGQGENTQGHDDNEGDAMVTTYARDGSTVVPLGTAWGAGPPFSISIANNWLLVGSPFAGFCPEDDNCIGGAYVFDLNRFRQ